MEEIKQLFQANVVKEKRIKELNDELENRKTVYSERTNYYNNLNQEYQNSCYFDSNYLTLCHQSLMQNKQEKLNDLLTTLYKRNYSHILYFQPMNISNISLYEQLITEEEYSILNRNYDLNTPKNEPQPLIDMIKQCYFNDIQKILNINNMKNHCVVEKRNGKEIAQQKFNEFINEGLLQNNSKVMILIQTECGNVFAICYTYQNNQLLETLINFISPNEEDFDKLPKHVTSVSTKINMNESYVSLDSFDISYNGNISIQKKEIKEDSYYIVPSWETIIFVPLD